MTPKLKLKLNADQLRALNAHLFSTLTRQAIEELRYYPQDFLICSSLQELYGKTNAKVEDIRMFPTRRTDVEYAFSMTRSQALALYCSIVTDDPATDETVSQTMPVLAMLEEPKKEVDSYEENFLRDLYGMIHRQFLI